MRSLSTLAIFAAAFAPLLYCGGCRSTVKGGTAQHSTGAFVADVPTPSGVVHIRDDRENVSTTQPTVETNTGQLPKIDGAKEGELGGVSLSEVKLRGMSGGFALSVVFGVVAVFAWYVLRRPVVAVVCLALAALTLLFPLWVGIGAAVVAVGGVLYLTNGHFKRIVGSVSHAIDQTLPADKASEFKGFLKEGQDHTDQRLVDAAKLKSAT